ncbi:hypothetical protein HPB50_017506 [Hyalomma asiaticum]|uniref:Uncharacterized protein n=1 Tax=Hyalomma asiaticum TaxID=266040 RepID=A0ACB7TM18_HYAAI|nr:hypothetical protein HPB50_017506 [Hyalomma asiaticum]
MNEGFESFRKDVETFRQELGSVKSENECYRKENEQLSKELQEYKREIVELKQHSRSMHIEIQGIPQVHGEDLSNTLADIADSLGIEVNARDIDVVHRVPSKGREKRKPNVVAKFLTRTARDKLLSAAKKVKYKSAGI